MTQLMSRYVTLPSDGHTARRTDVVRHTDEVRHGRSTRRSNAIVVLVAAVLALTAVLVAERYEQRVTTSADVATPDSDLTASGASADPSPAAPTFDAPLTSAVLPSGPMAVTLLDGSAAVTTGRDEPAVELATSRIGDLDLAALLDDVVIAQTNDEVSYDWGAVTEWYRPVADGVEHGYTLDEPVSASDDLTVTVDVAMGTPMLVEADTVAIERADSSTLWYRGLIAFDADGVDLPAEMAVADGAIELRVDTAGAQYPITIDPIITDAQLIRVEAGEPILGITQVADSDRLGTGGGGERVRSVSGGHPADRSVGLPDLSGQQLATQFDPAVSPGRTARGHRCTDRRRPDRTRIR